MSEQIYSAIGKRKSAVAKVFLTKGSGTIKVNQKNFATFFSGAGEELILLQDPLKLLEKTADYDIVAKVKGGGVSSQLEAIRLAISRCLCQAVPESRSELGKNLYLRRDSRVKEQKKYGLRKARKAPQYSKR
jgi:small subunit ribosomal protein S9